MLGKLKKTIKHTAVYSLGNISTKLVGLVLLPLYTTHLTTSEYGILSIIEITSQILIGMFTFNIPQAMIRWCATEKDKTKEKSIIFTTIFSVTLIAVFVVIALLPLNSQLSQLLFESGKFSNYFTLLVIWSFFSLINRVPASLIRLREKSVFFAVIMVSKFTIIMLLNIYFVAFADMGIEGIVWGQIIGEIYSLIITIPMMARNSHPKVNYKVFKEMLSYGWPLAFSAVSSLILASGDRYVLTYYLTFSSVGIYALAQKIASVINTFLLHSFQQGFLPIAFKMFNEQAPKRFFSKTLTYFTFILTITALGLSLFSREFIFAFTEEAYYSAYLIVPFIAFAQVIKGINFVLTIGFHHAKKTGVYALIIVGGMVLTVALNFLLIPFFEIYGAAIAMVISYTVMTIFTYYYSQKLYFIKFELGKVFLLLVLGIIFYLIGSSLPEMNKFLRAGIKLVLLISFPVALRIFNFYEEVELVHIKKGWKKWRNPFRWKANLKEINF
jgi:O-antigen/teichoic acid export membrane protein